MDYKLIGHKCKKIAEIETKLSDRTIWLGKLTEIYKKAPKETHCIHIKTPFKEIVLGVNSSDSWWLASFAQIIAKNDDGKMIIDDRIKGYIESIDFDSILP